MIGRAPKRRSFNTPGHAHELTFTTHHRVRVFDDEFACNLFLEVLEETRRQLLWEVWAYVLMPTHVHLLALPLQEDYKVARFLQRLKHPVSMRLTSHYRFTCHPMVERLRSETGVYRLWQAGGGYDRNIHSSEAARKSIDYIHNNPVVSGLVQVPWQYRWSSAAWYEDGSGPFQVDRFKG